MRNNLRMGSTMILIMVFVTVWSAMDGGRSVPLIVAASVGTVAGMMFLGHLGSMLPENRFTHAAFTGVWVLLYAPVWDWLAQRFTFPGSIYTAASFAVIFAVIRYFLLARSSRPPS